MASNPILYEMRLRKGSAPSEKEKVPSPLKATEGLNGAPGAWRIVLLIRELEDFFHEAPFFSGLGAGEKLLKCTHEVLPFS